MSKLTNWKYVNQQQPSMLWLIDRAPTIDMLVDLMKHATTLKDAAADTKKQWADACERRLFILQRNPPTFEKVGVVEALGEETARDVRLKMSVADVIRQVLDTRYFKCAEDGVFEFIGPGAMPVSIDEYFKEDRLQVAIDDPKVTVPSFVCPGCGGKGWYVKYPANGDPPEQEPCPTCGP